MTRTSKTLIPAVPPLTIARAALEERLAESLTRRLTTVVAGAGFGKTTLLAGRGRSPIHEAVGGRWADVKRSRIQPWTWRRVPMNRGSTLSLGLSMLAFLATSCSDDSSAPMNPDPDPDPDPVQQRIAFSSDRDGDFEVYVMNTDGSGVEQLTDDPGDDTDPAWSPDGTRIVFVSDRGQDPEFTDIYVMNADGSGLTNLTEDPAVDFDFSPVWSPDGSRIAFVREIDTGPDIFVMDADGSNLVNLTNDPDLDLDPAWSPDGSRIAFARVDSEDGSIHDIHVMNADGSGVTPLPQPGPDSGPAWSPDGSRIAFAGNPSGGNVEILVMDADGPNATNLTNDPPTLDAFDRTPAWSRDGDRIAFGTDRDGNREIYVMTAAGADLVNLTENAGLDANPAWGPEP